MKTRFYFFVLFLFCVKSISAQYENLSGKMKARIISENADGLYNFAATAENNSEIHYPIKYILLALKKSSTGNTSTNKQEGKYVVKPGETLTLSEIKTNLDKNDALKVYLFIKDEENDKVISKDSIEINPEKSAAKKSQYIPENDIELVGLTIDETRTKIGKHYYDQFFMYYLQSDRKFPGTVKIVEIPGLARSTRISVFYNDQEIYNFNTTPDEETTENEARNTLEILKRITLPKNELLKSST